MGVFSALPYEIREGTDLESWGFDIVGHGRLGKGVESQAEGTCFIRRGLSYDNCRQHVTALPHNLSYFPTHILPNLGQVPAGDSTQCFLLISYTWLHHRNTRMISLVSRPPFLAYLSWEI